MPERLFQMDYTMLALNATSIGALALAWLTEHMAGLGGLAVMLSVAVLNLAKAYASVKSVRSNKKNDVNEQK